MVNSFIHLEDNIESSQPEGDHELVILDVGRRLLLHRLFQLDYLLEDDAYIIVPPAQALHHHRVVGLLEFLNDAHIVNPWVPSDFDVKIAATVFSFSAALLINRK